MKEDQIPTAKLVMHEVQVGQPSYPDGVLISGTFEVVGVEWEVKKHWWRTKTTHQRPKTYEKKVAIPLMRKEVEKLIKDWTGNWETFENWRESIINKAAARKAFDEQFVAYHEAFNEIFPEETYEARLAEWKARGK